MQVLKVIGAVVVILLLLGIFMVISKFCWQEFLGLAALTYVIDKWVVS